MCLLKKWPTQIYSCGTVVDSKIPWYPKLLFQRENALASFWVTKPKPSRVNVTFHDIVAGPESGLAWYLPLDRVKCAIKRPWKIISIVSLRHFRIEIKHSVSGLCWDTKTLSGVAKFTSKPSADYILASPSQVLVSQHTTLRRGFNSLNQHFFARHIAMNIWIKTDNLFTASGKIKAGNIQCNANERFLFSWYTIIISH
jgi:hypothetical protein